MKILTASQIREADAYTIAHEPVKSINLMERAANSCFEWIEKKFTQDFAFGVFCGVGNNGGDGLVIARKLFEKGYNVEVFIIRFSEKCSPDFIINETRLKNLPEVPIHNIRSRNQLIEIFSTKKNTDKQVFIDAIFGTGLSRPLEGLGAKAISEINNFSKKNKTTVISIDIPSGLFCEDNSGNDREHIIKADFTLTFEHPKLALLFPENYENVGEWYIIPIGLHKKFISDIACTNFFTLAGTTAHIYKPRKKFSHKGTFGHSLLVCGSYGKMGAAVLCAQACLRAGAGLVTAHIPKCGYEILQVSVPEAMTSIDVSEEYLTALPKFDTYNSFGIGPGIGIEKQTQNVVKLLIQNTTGNLVMDADALNILSQNKTWLSFLPKRTILTPHPKEFERLIGQTSNDYERLHKQLAFSKKFDAFVILKGAHSCITCPDGEVFFNSTGNPGMATGGSGDVLTGLLTGLLAQGYSPKEASIFGVYLHGLSGDIAAEKLGYEALLAGDLPNAFGEAYSMIANKRHSM